jgi:hypothetical protein
VKVVSNTRYGGKPEQGQLSAELLTPAKPNLLDRIQQALRPGHFIPRTEQGSRSMSPDGGFVAFAGLRQPATLVPLPEQLVAKPHARARGTKN